MPGSYRCAKLRAGPHSWQPTETERSRRRKKSSAQNGATCLSGLAPSAAPACISILLSGARLNTIACNTHCADSWHVERREVRERMCVCVCVRVRPRGRTPFPANLGSLHIAGDPNVGPRTKVAMPCHAMPCKTKSHTTPS